MKQNMYHPTAFKIHASLSAIIYFEQDFFFFLNAGEGEFSKLMVAHCLHNASSLHQTLMTGL